MLEQLGPAYLKILAFRLFPGFRGIFLPVDMKLYGASLYGGFPADSLIV
jgi:hypothetical protein